MLLRKNIVVWFAQVPFDLSPNSGFKGSVLVKSRETRKSLEQMPYPLNEWVAVEILWFDVSPHLHI